MKVTSTGHIYDIHADTLQTYDRLPPQTYTVRFAEMRGFFLERYFDLEARETKVYGAHTEKVEKVLRAFSDFNRSLGVILSGDKGIGKSLFARMLAARAIEEGYPVIIVDQFIPGIAAYLESIEGEVMVLFDEYDKTFGGLKDDDRAQTSMLSLFDGTSAGKKLFVITCNELNKLSQFLVNRPGRFHYHFRFDYPTADEIRTYLTEKLPPECHGEIDAVISFSGRVQLNYDCLRAIAYELSHGESFADAIRDLNILNLNSGNHYTFRLLFDNGLVLNDLCSLDLFGEEEYHRWMDDNNHMSIAYVTFSPEHIQITPTGQMFVPGEAVCLKKINERDDSPDDQEDREYNTHINLAQSGKILRLEIKRQTAKNVSYHLG